MLEIARQVYYGVEKMSCFFSNCADCKHYIPCGGDGPKCEAFKDEQIPKEIFFSKRIVLDCNNGIGFESKD